MSCLSWNCRGLGQKRAVENLQQIIREKRHKFIFLVETLCLSSKVDEIKKLLH